MRREGPTWLAWLLGRIAYPPSRDRCEQCGRAGADDAASSQLQRAKMTETARWAALCPACRLEARDRRLKAL